MHFFGPDPVEVWGFANDEEDTLLSRSTTRTITFPARFAMPKPSGRGTLAIQVAFELIAVTAGMSLWLIAVRRLRVVGQ